MSFREPGIELQGFLCGLARFWFAVTRRHSVVGYLAQNRRRRSQSSIGFRIGRIVVNGLLKELNAASQVSAAAPGEFALLVSVARFSNLGRGRVNSPGQQRGRGLWWKRKRRQNLPRNGGGDIRFYLQDIRKFASERFGP